MCHLEMFVSCVQARHQLVIVREWRERLSTGLRRRSSNSATLLTEQVVSHLSLLADTSIHIAVSSVR